MVPRRRGPDPGSSRARGAPASGPRAPSEDPRRWPLTGPLCEEDEERLAREIPSIIQRIRLRKGRRFRGGTRGRLWVKRALRVSLAHGGVPFTLPMREHRPRQPRVVLLVDVSRSVARAAGLFLLVCQGLSERIHRLSVYFFVDRMIGGTELLRAWSSGRRRAGSGDRIPSPPGRRRPGPGSGIAPFKGARAFSDLLERLPDLNPGAPSDYGRAFFSARAPISRATGGDTLLVILGDARNNRADPLEWAFEEIAARCRRVIWLNPEPRGRWNEGDAVMGAYMPYCDVACEVSDLDGLAAGVREIVRSL